MRQRIFISSVQKEFARERKLLKYIYRNVANYTAAGGVSGGVSGEVNGEVSGEVNGGKAEVGALLSLIRENPGKRAPFYSNMTGWTVKVVQHQIEKLRNSTPPRIEFRGAPKTGGYYAL